MNKTQAINWDKQHIWHPFTQATIYNNQENLVIESAQGVELIDQEGKRYIDGVASLWVNIHGHNHPLLNRAIEEQLKKVAHTTLLGVTHPQAIELAYELSLLTNGLLPKVFYSDNGSTGVEVAIKIAFQYHHQKCKNNKKKKIVHLSDSYHGDTLGAVSVGGIELFHQIYGELTFKKIQIECPSSYEEPVSPEKELELERKMVKIIEKGHEEMSAFIVEPLVQGASGIRTYSTNFLKKIRELCTNFDITLIVDEVATGFYRTGTLFAYEKAKIIPDILVVAKGLTGGYLPLAATLVKEEIVQKFEGRHEELKAFFHGHTYTGNPLACAVALASLSLMKESGFKNNLKEVIGYLKKKLEQLSDLEAVGLIRQNGMMIGINIINKKGRLCDWKERVGEKICLRARKYGLLIRPLGSVIVIMPPLVILKEEVDRMFIALRRAIEEETRFISTD